MRPARVYLPTDILAVIRSDAAAKLGVREYRLVLKPTDLGQISVSMLEEGKPLGPFLLMKKGRVMVADRVDGEEVVLEDPFHPRGEYPVRVSIEKFREMKAAAVRHVRAEFLRLAIPFPPRGWESLCGIPPRIALQSLMASRRAEG